jgi:hypothetical protein
VLNTCIPKYFIVIKMNLDNYDDLSNSRKHIQNVRNSLELARHKHHM